MAKLTVAQQKSKVAATIKVNGNREITPPKDKILRDDQLDSSPNWKDGGLGFESEVGYSAEITPTSDYSFATRKYTLDSIAATALGYLKLDGSTPMAGPLNMDGNSINKTDLILDLANFPSLGTNSRVGYDYSNAAIFTWVNAAQGFGWSAGGAFAYNKTSNLTSVARTFEEPDESGTRALIRAGAYGPGMVGDFNKVLNNDALYAKFENVISSIPVVAGVYAPLAGGFSFTGNVNGVTPTELSYLSGVTSSIQTQLNAKGAGTVTSVSVTTANGVSGSVATPTTTPAITLTLGSITPTSVNGITFSGSGTQVRGGVSVTAGSSTTRNTAFGAGIQMGNTETTIFGATINIPTNVNNVVAVGSQINNTAPVAKARMFLYGINLQPAEVSTILMGTNLATTAADVIVLNPSKTSITTYTGGGYIGIISGASTATGDLSGNIQIGNQSIMQDGENHSICIGQLGKVYLNGTYGSAGGEQTQIGYKGETGSWRTVAVGAYATALAVSSMALHYASYVNAAHSTALGRAAYCINGASTVIYNGTTATNTLYVGGAYGVWTNPTIPETVDLVAQQNGGTRITVITTNSGLDVKPTPTNTNVSGAILRLMGGRGTGTANGGKWQAGVTLPGASGNTLNPDVVCLEISGATGEVSALKDFKIASGQKITLGNAAVTGLTAGVLAATTNATIVLYDSTGTAYRVPCIV